MNPIRFAIWTAVSTPSQTKEDKDSLPEQERTCLSVGLSKNWKDTGLRYTVPGISRTRWVNLSDAEKHIPSLHHMLEDAKQNRFDILILWDYNRLRDLIEPVAKSLANYGVQLYSTNQPIEPINPEQFTPYSSDSEPMMRGLSQIMSNWQIADLRRKYRFGMRGRLERGLPPLKIPYAYRRPTHGNKNSIPIIIPAQARIVKEIKSLFLKGTSINLITEHLTARYPTPSGIPKWSKQTVRKILLNPFYAGKVSFSRRLTIHDPRSDSKRLIPNPNHPISQGKHKPLYSWDDYLAILNEFDRRSKLPNTVRYPYSGALHCSQCKKRLRRCENGYRCLHCLNLRINDKTLMRIIPTALQNALSQITPSHQKTETESTETAQQELQRQRKLIQKGYESEIYTALEAEAKIKEIDARIANLKNAEHQQARQKNQQTQFIQTLQQTQKILKHLPEWFTKEDPKIVNNLLLRLCRYILITPQKQAIPVFHE